MADNYHVNASLEHAGENAADNWRLCIIHKTYTPPPPPLVSIVINEGTQVVSGDYFQKSTGQSE